MPNTKDQPHKGGDLTLRDIISNVLEQHDGISLDNAQERETLSEALEAQLSRHPGMRPK